MSASERLMFGVGGVLVCSAFAALGLALATDWRGLRARHVAQTTRLASPMRSLPPWRWLATRDADELTRRQERLERLLGWVFFTVGVVAGLTTLVAVALG